MEEQTLILVIFLTFSTLVVGKTFPAVGFREFKRTQTAARHRTFDNEARIKKLLRLNKKDVSGSHSRKRYARDFVLGYARISLNSKTSDQHRKKLRDLNSRERTGAIRRKRSADQRQKDPPVPYLLYIVGSDIKKLTLNDNVETTLVQLKNGSLPLFIDFHYKENRLYWAEGNSIHRSYLNDGTGRQMIHRDLPPVQGLAVDWFGNNIYWVVYVKGSNRNIMVSRTDGRYLKTLSLDSSRDCNLALDPEKGYMYWLSFDLSRGKIMKAAMYGIAEYDIIQRLPKHSNFAIDYYERKVYWTTNPSSDNPPSEIKSDKLDTDNIQDHKSTLVVASSRPESLSVSEEYVYWVDWTNSGSIQRANKTTADNTDNKVKDPPKTIKDNVTKARSLKFVHWNVQKDFVGNDVCLTRKYCSHLCLPDPSYHLFRCECPDNTTAVGTRYWNLTCVCPRGQFMDLNGDCTYLDAPWNLVAAPLNSTAIQLTWSPPKVPRSSKMMYYVFRGIYRNGVARWPLDRTSSTSFIAGQLKSYITYTFAVSCGIQGHRSLAVNIKPTDELIPPSIRPQSTSSEATLLHAPTTRPKSSTTRPKSSVATSSPTSSQRVSSYSGTSQSKDTDASTKRPVTELIPPSIQPQSTSSEAILSHAPTTKPEFLTTRTKSSVATSSSTSSQRVSTYSRPSQSKDTDASTKRPLTSSAIFRLSAVNLFSCNRIYRLFPVYARFTVQSFITAT